MTLLIVLLLLAAAVLFWLLRCVPFFRDRRDQEESVFRSALEKERQHKQNQTNNTEN